MRNQPVITLESLLRRRKTNLQAYLMETGITTYNLLVERCSRMGVQPPAPHVFEQYRPPTAPVSSPTEGVVILPPPDLIGDSGEKLVIEPLESDVEETTTEAPEVEEETDRKKKRHRN
jgi:hypothetical protein